MITISTKRSSRSQCEEVAGATLIETPMGGLYLCRNGDDQFRATWQALCDELERDRWDWQIDRSSADESLRKVAGAIEDYLSGDADVVLSAIPTPTGSPFHAACWAACRRIGRGLTISYTELARRAGSPMAMRAAGQAMRSNPLPIVVPCHRVVAHDGSLGGYSGTTDATHKALEIKRRLLAMEGAAIVSAHS